MFGRNYRRREDQHQGGGKPPPFTERMVNMKIAMVYEDNTGLTRCGTCKEELVCNSSGDMPETCPRCGALLDWSFYSAADDLPQEIIDGYGHTYERYSGKVYRSKARTHGNVAVFIPGTGNNGLYVISYGPLTPQTIEAAITSMGWRLEDWI